MASSRKGARKEALAKRSATKEHNENVGVSVRTTKRSSSTSSSSSSSSASSRVPWKRVENVVSSSSKRKPSPSRKNKTTRVSKQIINDDIFGHVPQNITVRERSSQRAKTPHTQVFEIEAPSETFLDVLPKNVTARPRRATAKKAELGSPSPKPRRKRRTGISEPVDIQPSLAFLLHGQKNVTMREPARSPRPSLSDIMVSAEEIQPSAAFLLHGQKNVTMRKPARSPRPSLSDIMVTADREKNVTVRRRTSSPLRPFSALRSSSSESTVVEPSPKILLHDAKNVSVRHTPPPQRLFDELTKYDRFTRPNLEPKSLHRPPPFYLHEPRSVTAQHRDDFPARQPFIPPVIQPVQLLPHQVFHPSTYQHREYQPLAHQYHPHHAGHLYEPQPCQCLPSGSVVNYVKQTDYEYEVQQPIQPDIMYFEPPRRSCLRPTALPYQRHGVSLSTPKPVRKSKKRVTFRIEGEQDIVPSRDRIERDVSDIMYFEPPRRSILRSTALPYQKHGVSLSTPKPVRKSKKRVTFRIEGEQDIVPSRDKIERDDSDITSLSETFHKPFEEVISPRLTHPAEHIMNCAFGPHSISHVNLTESPVNMKLGAQKVLPSVHAKVLKPELSKKMKDIIRKKARKVARGSKKISKKPDLSILLEDEPYSTKVQRGPELKLFPAAMLIKKPKKRGLNY